MTKTIVILTLLCACGAAWPQGTINFANVGAGLNAPVFLSSPEAADCEVRLMAGPDPAQLTFVGPAARFKFVLITNCNYNCYFIGGARTIPNVPGGSTAYVCVEVWSTNVPWGSVGQSSVFAVTLATPPEVPARLTGLTSFWATCLGRYFYYDYPPVSQAVLVGERVDFHPTIRACPVPQYQWFFNGVLIPGATRGYYEISSVQPQHAGTYTFSAAQLCGPSCSGGATLTVLSPPTITLSPLSQTCEAGSSLQLSSAATGSPPPTCQWLFSDSPLGGATTTHLDLFNIQPSQAGTYSFVATNAYGSATSAPAFLNVIAPVPRILVPGIVVQGEGPFNLDAASGVATPNWSYLDTLSQSGTSQWYFDAPVLTQRFYRAWQTNQPGVVPALAIHLVPELSLTGAIGITLRLDAINQFGPTGAWFNLSEFVLTNLPHLYHDTSALGQPPRLWRVTVLP